MSITEFPGLIAQEMPRLVASRRAIYRLSMPVAITRSSINQKVDDCDARQAHNAARYRAIASPIWLYDAILGGTIRGSGGTKCRSGNRIGAMARPGLTS